MPYIHDDIKLQLLTENNPEHPGELTYEIQRLLRSYLEARGLSYAVLAECLGSLEGAKLDLIKRVIEPYEHQKRMENGDVWPSNLLSTVREIPYA